VRVLSTADLHFKEPWYRWLLDHQTEFDLICIAGDLLDMFSSVPLADQIEIVTLRLHAAAEGTFVAVSSGNHDAVPPASDPTWSWFKSLSSPNILSDGQSRQFGDLLVTALPWQVSERSAREILNRAKRESTTIAKWLLLAQNACSSDDESTELRKLIIEFAPNYVLSGHHHTLLTSTAPGFRSSMRQSFSHLVS
jgi:predicted phosphodiesterase